MSGSSARRTAATPLREDGPVRDIVVFFAIADVTMIAVTAITASEGARSCSSATPAPS